MITHAGTGRIFMERRDKIRLMLMWHRCKGSEIQISQFYKYINSALGTVHLIFWGGGGGLGYFGKKIPCSDFD